MQTPKSHQQDEVIRHIKSLLYKGELLPGDRLPAERKLSEQLGVSRLHVRNALQKLEFYGIIKKYPQSGSTVAQLKVQALEKMISDVLQIDQYDFHSLVEVRILLETEAVRLCALHCTDEDLITIEQALIRCEALFGDPKRRVELDFDYHRAIALGSHNSVLASMLQIITPDILAYYRHYNACANPEQTVLKEHREMYRSIRERDPEGAATILKAHLKDIRAFARKQNGNHYFGAPVEPEAVLAL